PWPGHDPPPEREAAPGPRSADPGSDRVQEPLRGLGDLVHRAIEGLRVGTRGLAVAADLAHELKGGCPDLLLRRLLAGAAERLDASAHVQTMPPRFTREGRPPKTSWMDTLQRPATTAVRPGADGPLPGWRRLVTASVLVPLSLGCLAGGLRLWRVSEPATL